MRHLSHLISFSPIILQYASINVGGANAQGHSQEVPREGTQEKAPWQHAWEIRKMSQDGGEKFWPEYYNFGESSRNSSVSIADTKLAHRPRLRQIIVDDHVEHGLLTVRDFKCPDNTNACTNVGSDLCCPSGQNCVSFTEGIGCCPSGQTCGGIATGCDTAAGYSECPNSPNGGCCIPGARCEGEGCVFYGTSIVVASGPPTTVTQTRSSSLTTTSSPVSSILTTTVTITQVIGGQTTTIVSATTVYAQSSTETSHSTSGTASAAIRPTSQTSVSSDTAVSGAQESTTTSSRSSSSSETSCPTGFYMCSAVYLGGCCRVDRNCDTMSCPSTASTTVISSGPTIVVPAVTNSAGQKSGSCANGWFSCAQSEGGGCCPSGYVCGESCTATNGGQANTAKMAPENYATITRAAWTLVILAICSGLGMLVL